MKVFHILNPSGPARVWARAVTGRETRAWPWGWVSHEHPAHTETLIDWALKEGATRLVVWGGDGTFHRAVKFLRVRRAFDRVELALVPAGTCNDLARRMGLTKRHWRRWEEEKPGRLARLSLGLLRYGADNAMQEEVFVNNAGFGRPRSAFETRQAPWDVLMSFESIPVAAHWPGGGMRGLYFMALACNAPYFSGGLHFEKKVSPEDDLLDFYFVPARSKPRLAARLILGRLGFPLYDGKITRVRAASLSLETERPVWPQADGEPPSYEGAQRVEFSLLPEKVNLWVPA